MDRLSPAVLRGSRATLVILWCATAAISILELHGRPEALLAQTSVPATWYRALIISGALLDAATGLAMWRWHRRIVYKFAAANLLVMTMAATLLLPALWLDPLGSLAKNLPVAALLWVLHEEVKQ